MVSRTPARSTKLNRLCVSQLLAASAGLFLTTGRFTRDAALEAVRDGAPAIDLIDGLALCELLRKLELGVSTELVESIKPQPEFFAEL